MYSPLASVLTVRVSAVPSLVTVILALDITAPEASVTVPRMVPLTDWATATEGPDAMTAAAVSNTRQRIVDGDVPACLDMCLLPSAKRGGSPRFAPGRVSLMCATV